MLGPVLRMHKRADPMRRRGQSSEVSASACAIGMTSGAITPATTRLVMPPMKACTELAMLRRMGNGSEIGEHCLNCGVELKVNAAIPEAPMIEKVLTHVALQVHALPPAREQLTYRFSVWIRDQRRSANGVEVRS